MRTWDYSIDNLMLELEDLVDSQGVFLILEQLDVYPTAQENLEQCCHSLFTNISVLLEIMSIFSVFSISIMKLILSNWHMSFKLETRWEWQMDYDC